MDNHASTRGNLRPAVERQINRELDNGHYRRVQEPPNIVSPLGAIPKSEPGKIRLIHDGSRPSTGSLNDYAFTNPFTYQSVQDAVDLIRPGYYMAKVDLSSAYRSVRIHPTNTIATGIKWQFSGDGTETFMVDERLPFGARRSPEIFHRLTQAVKAMMVARGFPGLVVYLDDFILVAPTRELCTQALNTLLSLLRTLGFAINYNKVVTPTQRLTFLGITLDSVAMTLALPHDKIVQLTAELTRMVTATKVTKRQIQSLCGRLNWATQVIYGGRFHLRRLLDKMNTLQKPWHRARTTLDMKADIQWWLEILPFFNGQMPMVDTRPAAPVSIDACTAAAGAFYLDQYIYTPWDTAWPQVAGEHINHKEVLALYPAVCAWAPLWRDKKIFVHCDNQTACAIINRGHCKHPLVMDVLRRIYHMSVGYNFRLRAVYYPGAANRLADCASRLHEQNKFEQFQAALSHTCFPPV
jgi:hypothetical protein